MPEVFRQFHPCFPGFFGKVAVTGVKKFQTSHAFDIRGNHYTVHPFQALVNFHDLCQFRGKVLGGVVDQVGANFLLISQQAYTEPAEDSVIEGCSV